jgi:Leucine rich repeat
VLLKLVLHQYFICRLFIIIFIGTLASISSQTQLEHWFLPLTFAWGDKIDYRKHSCSINDTEMTNIKFQEPFFNKTVTSMHIINTTKTSIPINLNDKFPSLLNLRVELTDLSEMTQVQTQALTNIVNLYLGNNIISSISNDAFHNTTQLKLLYLNGNRISNLHSSTFKKLANLERLFLENNNITELSAEIFSQNVNLQRIYLQNNKLLVISKGTFDLPNLSVLNVRDNICINKWTFDANIVIIKEAIEDFCHPSVENLRKSTIYLMKIIQELTIRDHILRKELMSKKLRIRKMEQDLAKYKYLETTTTRNDQNHESDEW